MQQDEVRVRHAIQAAEKAIQFAGATRRDRLDLDEALAYAIIHMLEVLGEACNQVSQDFRQANPQVPWSKAISLRHRLIHGYFDVDLDIVWSTVTQRVPELVRLLKATIGDERADPTIA